METRVLLRRLRGGKSQQEFADLLNVAQSTVSRIENGSLAATVEFVAALVRVFPAFKTLILDVFFDPDYVQPATIEHLLSAYETPCADSRP